MSRPILLNLSFNRVITADLSIDSTCISSGKSSTETLNGTANNVMLFFRIQSIAVVFIVIDEKSLTKNS